MRIVRSWTPLTHRTIAVKTGFILDREQSSALRATLRLIPGAGVTPAAGAGRAAPHSIRSSSLYVLEDFLVQIAHRLFVLGYVAGEDRLLGAPVFGAALQLGDTFLGRAYQYHR